MDNEKVATVWHSAIGGILLLFAIVEATTEGLPSGGTSFYAAILSFTLAARKENSHAG
tara:strand:- start:3019 stop:3192 length:174 start_codon:yes stop_codon:yes gene_type:complete